MDLEQDTAHLAFYLLFFLVSLCLGIPAGSMQAIVPSDDMGSLPSVSASLTHEVLYVP